MNLSTHLPVRQGGGLTSRRSPGFDTLQREIDRIFDVFGGGAPTRSGIGLFPSLDVTETDKEIKVSCELPGMEEKDVQLSLTDDVLTIRGEKRAESEDKDGGYQHMECAYGAFSRTVELPAHVDPNQVQARMKRGVLKITAPKTPAPNATRIEIKPEG
jgi:HSP20 family protein